MSPFWGFLGEKLRVICKLLLDGWLMNMLSPWRIKCLIVMESLCLVNITKHKTLWYIQCCVIRFLVYWAGYRAMATTPEIGTMSILVVKMMMVIEQFVNCWRLMLLHIHYHLVVRGSARRCKCGSLTEIFNLK